MAEQLNRKAGLELKSELHIADIQLLKAGANDGIRTRDLLITNQLLYQLSYVGGSVRARFAQRAGEKSGR
jgi:hypothetical protein